MKQSEIEKVLERWGFQWEYIDEDYLMANFQVKGEDDRFTNKSFWIFISNGIMDMWQSVEDSQIIICQGYWIKNKRLLEDLIYGSRYTSKDVFGKTISQRRVGKVDQANPESDLV